MQDGRTVNIKNICTCFCHLGEHLRDFQCDDLVIGGDLNLVLDLDKGNKVTATKRTPDQLKHQRD